MRIKGSDDLTILCSVLLMEEVLRFAARSSCRVELTHVE